MMKLLSNPLSPYGRKVKIAMGLKGLKDRIEIVQVDTNPADNPMHQQAQSAGQDSRAGDRQTTRPSSTAT